MGKRSADAEPEADALYGVYGYGYPSYTYGAYRPYAYTTRWGYGKRSADAEAEADPALLYTNAVPAVHSVVRTHAVVGSPLVHHTYAVPTVAKTVVPAVTVAKAADHGVVGTYAGLVHSSHAGICLNNVGVQVPC